MSVDVTAKDNDSGDSETVTIDNDYVLTTAGTCFVAGVQAYKNGTHVITVKGRAALTTEPTPTVSEAMDNINKAVEESKPPASEEE